MQIASTLYMNQNSKNYIIWIYIKHPKTDKKTKLEQ